MLVLRKLLPVFIIVLIIVLGTGGYLIYKNKKATVAGAKTNSVASQAPSEDDTKKIIAEIGKVMKLPTDETPTVRTIVDVEKLKAASYGAVFKNAKNGNYVLIYTTNKQIIIYDQIAKQLVNVAPFNVATESAQPNPVSPQ